VDAVLADWRTAPVAPGLRAVLGLLQKATLTPAELRAADVDAARAKGVSDEAIEDALAVCACFNLIDRLADSFGFTPISHMIGHEGLMKREAEFLERGYV
jgi:alkylhydroperoxidase family enzyme